MNFSQLGLSTPILRALAHEGYTTPTPIQGQAIPHVLGGRDVLGCAQTGTGKTAAFALPILHRLCAAAPDKSRRGPRPPRTLVLSPTRELAGQIANSFAAYGRETGLSHTVIYGGVSQMHQERSLRRGVDILVATPGRLLDLLEQGLVDLSQIEVLVLDEADRMLDMGFIDPIRRIAAKTPGSRQTLLFSATMPRPIVQLAGSLLRDPVRVAVDPVSSAVAIIEQSVYMIGGIGVGRSGVGGRGAGGRGGTGRSARAGGGGQGSSGNCRDEKQLLLEVLLADPTVERALVFSRTKHGAERIGRRLERAGVAVATIHGNKNQNQRERALDRFRSTSRQRARVLVATDVAARGLDVDGITHVFNFDLPVEPEAYIHRIGRTGRAGAGGVAMSFCGSDERGLLREIERLTGAKIQVRTAEISDEARAAAELARATPDRARATTYKARPAAKNARAAAAKTRATRNGDRAAPAAPPTRPARGWKTPARRRVVR